MKSFLDGVTKFVDNVRGITRLLRALSAAIEAFADELKKGEKDNETKV